MIDIVIDSEFKALIPPLSDAELEGLESDIVEAGRALVPLMLWNKILVDGHNRYAICTEHDLPYEVMEVGHPEWTRTDARIWIRRNQLHRRNIDGLTRCEIALGSIRIDEIKVILLVSSLVVRDQNTLVVGKV